jgi:hypothetical protein
MNNVELRQKALENGLCEKWAIKWTDDWSVNNQLNALMSLDGMSFLAEKHFPSLGFILENAEGKHEQYGLLIKKTSDITLNTEMVKYHLCGCVCDVYLPKWWIGFLYLSHGSNVRIFAGDNVDCRLRMHRDSTCVVATKGDGSDIIIEYLKDQYNDTKVQVS